jgi:hypothetical protein
MRRVLFVGVYWFSLAAGCGGSAFEQAGSDPDASADRDASGSDGSGPGGTAGTGSFAGSTGGFAGSTGGVGGSGGFAGSTGGVGGSGGVGGTGGSETCEQLLADVHARLEEAKRCCPFCGALQCTGSVPGPCCDETVGYGESPETAAYLEAYKIWTNSGCFAACPRIACLVTPSYDCVVTGSTGRCR